MPGQYGTTVRTKRRINVLRGYAGNESSALTRYAKPKDDEGILSGMLISLDDNGEWVKGAAEGKEAFFAGQDQADPNSRGAGKLLGFSCSGEYELETAHYDATTTYANGNGLKAMAGGDAGKVTKLTSWAEDVDVVGTVSRGVVDVTSYESGCAKDNDGFIKVLTLNTRWIPTRAA